MLSDLNRVTMIGTLSDEPESKTIASGRALCNLRITVTESWTGKDNRGQQSRTSNHRASCWGDLAEQCAGLHKGDRVLVEGKLSNRSYDRDGAKVWVTEIQASTVASLSGSTGAATTYEPPSGSTSAPPSAPQDDSIPF